jgi:hypothetical protein
MKRCILVCFLLAAMVGCATSKTAPSFTTAPTPVEKSEKAVLYIFRRYAEPVAVPAYFEIDKVEATTLKQQGFTWVYVTPGEHNFKFGWPFWAGMPSVGFKQTLEAGKSYAFEMLGTVGNPYVTSEIAPIDIEDAKDRMKNCCRYVPSTYKAK